MLCSYTGLSNCNNVNHVVEESMIMANFDHLNVMKLLGVSFDTNKTPFLVMPFMANGNLLSYLRKNRENLATKSEDVTELVIKHVT